MAYKTYKREVEEVMIPFKRYRIDGIPVCASWYGNSSHEQEVCRFIGSKCLGSVRVCMIR